MTEITFQAQMQVVGQKLMLWQNTLYSEELNAKIATAIGDDQMLAQAKERMKRSLKVIDQLVQIRTELVAGDKLASGEMV